MEDDLIEVIESKHGLIEENVPRVERLFCVHVDFTRTNGGSWSCEVSPETSCTPEDVVKAKVYIHSLLGEGEDFTSLVIPFNPSLQTMILKTRDDIERETAVIISPGQHDNGIKIYGPLNRIIDAKFIIEGLLRQHMIAADSERELNNDDTTYLSTQPSQIPQQNSLDRDSSPRFQHFMKTNVDSGQFSQMNSDSLFGKDNIDSYQDFGYPKIQRDMLYYGNLTSGDGDGEDSSSESSDDDEDIPEIQNNPDYPAKIEFALKLGYHEADLVRALKKLGLDASQNELLSELIKNGISQGESCPRPDFVEGLSQPSDDVEESTRESTNQTKDASDNLRHIIIDGSNIAMSHGNKETFSCHGIKVAVDWFKQRGHKDITVFVPQWRKETSRSDSRIKDQTILSELEKEKVLVYTPARRIGGKRVICYDDRYILKLAVDTDGIVVSNDNYRDLLDEKEEFKKVIEERLLMYSFVNDRFMPPDDPLGRNGPTLEAFLQKESPLPKSLPPLCPYGSKKCTYGNKCKYYHPERRNTPQKSVTEKLAEQAKQRMLEVKERNADVKKPLARTSLCRTKSLNPGEVGKNPEHSRLTSSLSLSGSPSTINTQSEETYQVFNQKLSENLRKMTKEKDSKETPLPKTPEKKVKKKNKETPNQSSPRWNFPQGGDRSPRGTSPVSNLIVPGHDMEFDDSESFLSGHLLLAKKLSDEANEFDKNKKAGKAQNESSSVPGHGTGVSFHFSEIPSSHKPEHNKLKQKAHQPLQKQALSRQLSLQGNEDPRLRQMHGALKPQYSYGGTSQHIANNMPDQSDIKSLMSDFMKGQNQSLVEKQGAYGDTDPPSMHQSALPQHRTKPTLTRMSSEGFTPSFGQELPFSLGMPAHTPLTRMQSAPDPHALKHQQMRNQRRMTRQNSSSDTQLNKLDSLDEASIQMYGRQFYPDPFSEPVYRGVMESVTNRNAPVAFQFGGPQTGLSHSRSIGSNIQSVQQFSNPPNVHQFIGSRDVYPYPTNQQFNQQRYETPPHPHQQHLPYRNVVGAGGSYGVPVQSGMTPYSGMSVNQSMYGPPPLSSAGLGQGIGHTGQHAHNNMAGQGLGSGHGHLGVPNYPPGPPHFLDQQTSQIWGNSGTTLPMGGCFSGSDCNEGSSGVQTGFPFQQQLRSSPVPVNTDSISQSDPRYELYCNLCKLFPEDKVRTVMRLHPELDNPNEICAYLIGAK